MEIVRREKKQDVQFRLCAEDGERHEHDAGKDVEEGVQSQSEASC